MAQHDASYKLLFSSPEMVRDLVVGFMPQPWLRQLDFTTLQRVACGFIADDLRQRNGDVLWRMQVNGEWAYLYLLLEFQSTVDPYMAVRVATYVGLLYQDLVRTDAILPGRRLPPVLPVVLYNGAARWNAAIDIDALVPPLPDGLDRYQLRQGYVLINESDYPDEQLAHMDNLVAAVMRFERPSSPAAMVELVSRLNRRLHRNPELKRTFATWLGAVLSRHSQGALQLSHVQDLKEMEMAMAVHFERWAEQYKKEGEQRGIEKGIEKGRDEGVQLGEAMALLKLVTRRFGKPPMAIESRIRSASPEQLEQWIDRFVCAQSPDDIFRD